jgi:hypothetical protein
MVVEQVRVQHRYENLIGNATSSGTDAFYN